MIGAGSVLCDSQDERKERRRSIGRHTSKSIVPDGEPFRPCLRDMSSNVLGVSEVEKPSGFSGRRRHQALQFIQRGVRQISAIVAPKRGEDRVMRKRAENPTAAWRVQSDAAIG